MKGYVFDSYALIALFEEEKGADTVEEVIREVAMGESEGWMSIINWGEVYYTTFKEHGEKKALEAIRWIDRTPIVLVDAGRELTQEAARLKAKYPIAYADCFALALAKMKNASLLTGDPEFKKTNEEVEFIWLGDANG